MFKNKLECFYLILFVGKLEWSPEAFLHFEVWPESILVV